MFTPDEQEAMRGGVASHNHPDDDGANANKGFSIADIGYAAKMELKETRVLAHDGHFMSMRPGESGKWPAVEEISRVYKQEYDKFLQKAVAMMHSPAFPEMRDNYQHHVWGATAKTLGMRYFRGDL